MKIRVSIDVSAGRVVRYFILVDAVLLLGWGVIDPIFSIFIVDHVAGATLATVGALAAFYWFLRSFLPLPLAKFLDRKPGEKDDFYALIIGLFLTAFSAFGFAFVREIWQAYAVQFVKALGFSLYAASWPAIFSRHLDKDKIAFDWAIDSTAVGLGAGIGAFLGGIVAEYFGFPAVFLLGGLFALGSAFVLMLAPDLVFPSKTSSEPVRRDQGPRNLLEQ